MTRKAPKISTMVGEIFEICWHKMTRKALEFSTMVGEIFEISIIHQKFLPEFSLSQSIFSQNSLSFPEFP